ncbi:MAG: fumarylacetoacetate hydrolase family protein [Vitreoscilla sp.]|nr:fumarylacetoacetate hydrolase family protein [Vitreoscilla sp.]
MKWLRFMLDGRETLGALEGDAVRVYVGDLFGPHEPTAQTLPVAGLHWLTPCTPGKIIGLWNNFRAAAAKNQWAEPAEPLYFLKANSSALAHGQPIPVPPAYDGRVAFEGELAVVIGRRARHVAVADAPGHILGYTCTNDVTAMELIGRDPSFAQWARAKSMDGFGAFGPVIETNFDPATATLRTLVGGRERQNYPLDDMFFNPAELVSRLSADMTLEPGDVILCGTSLGVLPMKPGTLVEVTIDGIGTLANTYGGSVSA